jgi:hypothetical protein
VSSNCSTIVDVGLETMWKKATMDYLKRTPQSLDEITEKNYEKHRSKYNVSRPIIKSG